MPGFPVFNIPEKPFEITFLAPSRCRAATCLSLGNAENMGSRNVPVIYYQMTICGEGLRGIDYENVCQIV